MRAIPDACLPAWTLREQIPQVQSLQLPLLWAIGDTEYCSVVVDEDCGGATQIAPCGNPRVELARISSRVVDRTSHIRYQIIDILAISSVHGFIRTADSSHQSTFRTLHIPISGAS